MLRVKSAGPPSLLQYVVPLIPLIFVLGWVGGVPFQAPLFHSFIHDSPHLGGCNATTDGEFTVKILIRQLLLGSDFRICPGDHLETHKVFCVASREVHHRNTYGHYTELIRG
ncbi:hypothetical protein ACP70R_007739 [Stipagrostis hirtigluma subsp. patula]